MQKDIFEELEENLKQDYEDVQSWVIDVKEAGYEKRYQIQTKALQNVKSLYNATDISTFRNILCDVFKNPYNYPGNIFELLAHNNDDNLSVQYRVALDEFNKNFIIANFDKFTTPDLIKYIITNVGSEMAEQTIEIMLLHIDAPEEFKKHHLNAKW